MQPIGAGKPVLSMHYQLDLLHAEMRLQKGKATLPELRLFSQVPEPPRPHGLCPHLPTLHSHPS